MLDTLCGESKSSSILLTGNPESGSSLCFYSLIEDGLTGKPVWLFQRNISSVKYSELKELALSKGYRIHYLSTSECKGNGFDVLSLSNNINQKAEIVYGFVRGANDTPEMRADKIHLLSVFLYALKAQKKQLTLINILSLSLEDAIDIIDSEKERVYLKMGKTKDRYLEIETLSKMLLNNGVAEYLSKNRDIYAETNKKVLICVVKADDDLYGDCNYERLSNAMLAVAAKLVVKYNVSSVPYHIYIQDTELIYPSIMKKIMELGKQADHQAALCVYEPGIQDFIQKNLSLTDTLSLIIAFNCIGSDAEILSQLYGTRNKPEISQSYGKKGLISFSLNIGGVVDRKHGKYQGMTVSRTEKRIYEPRVFSALKYGECILYWVASGRTGRKRI